MSLNYYFDWTEDLENITKDAKHLESETWVLKQVP